MALGCATSVGADGTESDRFLRLIAGGKQYQRRRRIAAEQRRLRVVQLLRGVDLQKRGWRAEIAREIGCHRGTIGRDIAAIGAMVRRHREAADRADAERRQRFFWLLVRCEHPELFEVPA